MPNPEQITCYKQDGCTDCGLFAIAYAVDILNANNVYDLIFDQIKMRKQLTLELYEKSKSLKNHIGTLRKQKYIKNIQKNIFTMEQAPTFSWIKIKNNTKAFKQD